MGQEPACFLRMKRVGSCFVFLAVCFLSSCSQHKPYAENGAGQGEGTGTAEQQSFEIKTFKVEDSNGKPAGWGYDIYINFVKTIHQPIIPAIHGNNSFKTKADAQRTAAFVVNKIKATESLPTLTMNELDSLGITR